MNVDALAPVGAMERFQVKEFSIIPLLFLSMKLPHTSFFVYSSNTFFRIVHRPERRDGVYCRSKTSDPTPNEGRPRYRRSRSARRTSP